MGVGVPQLSQGSMTGTGNLDGGRELSLTSMTGASIRSLS